MPAQAEGSVVSIWRYPVKSMMGEELAAAEVTRGGLLGDRAYALVDAADGKVATAKNPRKWPRLFAFSAALAKTGGNGSGVPPVRISMPGGVTVDASHAAAVEILSKALGRPVSLGVIAHYRHEAALAASATAEAYWPDMEGLEHRDTVTAFGLPEGTFFDSAQVHLLTTGTLERLHSLYPEGRFEPRRFRPNLLVETGAAEGFPEDAWVGGTLAIGESVRLRVTGPCLRCVMTTLAQGDLPADPGILRTAVRHHGGNVGVYASVFQGGTVRQGDSVRLV